MGARAWRGFCVVGIGGHARTKLIPAIAANGQSLAGLVSRQPAEALPDAPVFASVAAALALPPDIAFLIVSPPALHFEQAMTALRAGRDVLVEKPAFLTEAQATDAAAAAEASGAVLAEGFMHRHTNLYRRLLEDWWRARAGICGIDVVFTVPGLPADTFRQGHEIGGSVLFDIGCYAVSLLLDLGLELDPLRLDEVERPGGAEELLRLSARSGGVDVRIAVGVAEAYENAVTLRRRDCGRALYAPFFYGRPGRRSIVVATAAGEATEETMTDLNAFEVMLAVPRAEWLAGQRARTCATVAATACLERLGDRLLALRTVA